MTFTSSSYDLLLTTPQIGLITDYYRMVSSNRDGVALGGSVLLGEHGNVRHEIVVEAISIIYIRNMLASLAEGRHLQVRVEAKMLTHRDINIRFLKWVTQVAVVMGGFFHSQNPYDRYSQFSVMSRCAI